MCRKRKIKCNRESPCNNCLRSRNSVCEYAEYSSPPPRRARYHHPTPTSLTQESEEHQPSIFLDKSSSTARGSQMLNHASSSLVHNSASPSTPFSQSSAREVEALRSKIKQLEDQLARAERESAAPTPVWDSRGNSSQIAGAFHVRREPPSEGEAPTMSRMIVHKTRVLGQSHWINGVAEVSVINLE